MAPPRPESPTEAPATRYLKQLLEAAELGTIAGWAVAFASWLLLAGFVVLPGTFTNITDFVSSLNSDNAAAQWVYTKIQNLPLIGIAAICSGSGALYLLGFWYRWRKNYLLITDKVFLPGFFQGLAGVLSTLVSVYTAQGHTWSIMARISIIVEGGTVVFCGFWFAFYWVLIFPMKREHDKRFKDHRRRLTMVDEEAGVTSIADKSEGRTAPSRKGTGRPVATTRKSTTMTVSDIVKDPDMAEVREVDVVGTPSEGSGGKTEVVWSPPVVVKADDGGTAQPDKKDSDETQPVKEGEHTENVK